MQERHIDTKKPILQQQKIHIVKTLTLFWTLHITLSKHHKLPAKRHTPVIHIDTGNVQIWFQSQGIIVHYLATCIQERWLWHGFRNLSPGMGYMKTWFWSGTRVPWGEHWAVSATQPLNSQSADNAVVRVSQFLPSSGPLETHSLQLEKKQE